MLKHTEHSCLVGSGVDGVMMSTGEAAGTETGKEVVGARDETISGAGVGVVVGQGVQVLHSPHPRQI